MGEEWRKSDIIEWCSHTSAYAPLHVHHLWLSPLALPSPEMWASPQFSTIALPSGFYQLLLWFCLSLWISLNKNCGQCFSCPKSTAPQYPSNDTHLLHTCFSFNVPFASAPRGSAQWALGVILDPPSAVIFHLKSISKFVSYSIPKVSQIHCSFLIPILLP